MALVRCNNVVPQLQHQMQQAAKTHQLQCIADFHTPKSPAAELLATSALAARTAAAKME